MIPSNISSKLQVLRQYCSNISGFVALLLIVFFGCCGKPIQPSLSKEKVLTQPMENAKQGEFILSLSKDIPKDKIRSCFHIYGILRLELINQINHSYLLIIKRDPGLEELESLAKEKLPIRYIERNQTIKKYK